MSAAATPALPIVPGPVLTDWAGAKSSAAMLFDAGPITTAARPIAMTSKIARGFMRSLSGPVSSDPTSTASPHANHARVGDFRSMRQLTSLDAQFLALESARQTGHVGGLAILDPSTAPGGKIDGGDIQRLLEERLPALPPFRWKLAQVPMGLDFPYWIEDPDFDLNFHVREIALP